MAELKTVAAMEKIILAAAEGGIPVSSIEIEPEKLKINFGEPTKLQQTADNAPVGNDNPDAQMLERALNDDKKVEIEADAAYKTKDTVDIHFEHKEKLAGGIEVEGTMQDLAKIMAEPINQPVEATEQQFVQSVAADVPPIPMAADIVPEIVQPQQFISDNATVTLSEGNKVRVQFDEKTVNLEELEKQISALAKDGKLGENGEIVAAQAMQEVRAEVVKQPAKEVDNSMIPTSEVVANASADSPTIRKIPTNESVQANSQISDAAYQGIAASKVPQVIR